MGSILRGFRQRIAVNPDTEPGFNIIPDINYFIPDLKESTPHKSHKLDIWLPVDRKAGGTNNDNKSLIPIVIHVHGGGWQRGHKNNEWRGKS